MILGSIRSGYKKIPYHWLCVNSIILSMEKEYQFEGGEKGRAVSREKTATWPAWIPILRNHIEWEGWGYRERKRKFRKSIKK